jgi:hypothetical protein
MEMNENQFNYPARRHPIFKGLRIAGMTVFGIVAAAIFALVFGIFVMLLWNWLMPTIFGLVSITYWQAFGIVILAKLIFGALGRGREHFHAKSNYHHRMMDWGPFKDRWWKCGRDEWKYYQDFWKEEGKNEFENYIKRRKEEA